MEQQRKHNMATIIHESADVSPAAVLGENVKIWHQAQVRERATLGDNCIVGKGAYVDMGVRLGDNCKLQNGVFLFHGVSVEDGVFFGPGAILTNDRLPRAITPDGALKTDDDWEEGQIIVRYGASIGARAVILPGVEIGRFALVGAGSVVTHDVPTQGLVYGNPARLRGYVCECGRRLVQADGAWRCEPCNREFELPNQEFGK